MDHPDLSQSGFFQRHGTPHSRPKDGLEWGTRTCPNPDSFQRDGTPHSRPKDGLEWGTRTCPNPDSFPRDGTPHSRPKDGLEWGTRRTWGTGGHVKTQTRRYSLRASQASTLNLPGPAQISHTKMST